MLEPSMVSPLRDTKQLLGSKWARSELRVPPKKKFKEQGGGEAMYLWQGQLSGTLAAGGLQRSLPCTCHMALESTIRIALT